MKNCSTFTFRPVRVVRNTVRTNSPNDKWMKIVDAQTGIQLHCGQPEYIKRVARQKYNVSVV